MYLNNLNMSFVFQFLSLLFLVIYACGERKVKEKIKIDQNQANVTREYNSVREKKIFFFSHMIPIIQAENLKVSQERSQLEEAIKSQDTVVILELKDKYRIKKTNVEESLLLAIDIVPLELVLAQSANESQWGESRFARQGNNFFGQWCFVKGCGIVPSLRSKNASHEVRVFKSVNQSVASYIYNINSNRAYRNLRKLRFQMREKKQNLDPVVLAKGLLLYSERKQEYVREIQEMIRYNHKIIEDLVNR